MVSSSVDIPNVEERITASVVNDVLADVGIDVFITANVEVLC